MSRPPRRKARPTQAERRARTVQRLTDAALRCVLEVGYARTTVSAVCRRAGLTSGALFRFFPTLTDLMLAAAEEVGRRQIAEFERRFATERAQAPALPLALKILRDICRSPTNAVFYELLVAARTDAELCRKLRPGIAAYITAIRVAAERVPEFRGIPAEFKDIAIFGVSHLFDGEAVLREVYPQPKAEDARLQLLQRFAESL